MTSNWSWNTHQDVLRTFEPNNIFNADETGLFYRCIREDIKLLQRDLCSTEKNYKKDRQLWLAAISMVQKKFFFLLLENVKIHMTTTT